MTMNQLKTLASICWMSISIVGLTTYGHTTDPHKTLLVLLFTCVATLIIVVASRLILGPVKEEW